MTIDLSVFRRTMGRFASGVTVVTTREETRLYGLTISAFLSLSQDPPLVLISVASTTLVGDVIARTGIFAVNILSEQQQHLSRGFSTCSTERYEHFCHAEYFTRQTGAPILAQSTAYVDCCLVRTCEGGDHTLFIGEVKALDVSDLPPLLHFRGAYHHLCEPAPQALPLFLACS